MTRAQTIALIRKHIWSLHCTFAKEERPADTKEKLKRMDDDLLEEYEHILDRLNNIYKNLGKQT